MACLLGLLFLSPPSKTEDFRVQNLIVICFPSFPFVFSFFLNPPFKIDGDRAEYCLALL